MKLKCSIIYRFVNRCDYAGIIIQLFISLVFNFVCINTYKYETIFNHILILVKMGDLDTIYLQGLALLHSNDPASSKKLVILCEDVIASSEWAGVTISETGDLSNLVWN